MKSSEAPEESHDIAREDVPTLRATMKKLGVVVAEVDRDLRYVWIDNPHPDFDSSAVIGKRDDQLIPKSEAEDIMMLKREALDRRSTARGILKFKRSDGLRYYSISAHPVREPSGKIHGVITVGFDVPPTNKRKKTKAEPNQAPEPTAPSGRGSS